MSKENLKKMFGISRFYKAFLFAVTVGLGAYLGKIFFQMHWFWALVFVTLLMMIFGGKLLDALFKWD